MTIRGHRKYRREGGNKNCDRVGVKIWLQGGGQIHGTGKGELLKKTKRTIFWQN